MDDQDDIQRYRTFYNRKGILKDLIEEVKMHFSRLMNNCGERIQRFDFPTSLKEEIKEIFSNYEKKIETFQSELIKIDVKTNYKNSRKAMDPLYYDINNFNLKIKDINDFIELYSNPTR
jgi:hypothetical protein